MTALRQSLDALVAVQQIDKQIQQLKRRQAGLDTGAKAEAVAVTAKFNCDAATSAHHKAAGDLKDCELKQAAVESKMASYQKKLYEGTVTNPKELANIEKEIGALSRQRSDLDGRILELMDQVECEQTKVAVALAEYAAADGTHKATREAHSAQQEQIGQEIQSLTRQRTDAVGAVNNAALLKRYDEIRAKSGGIGIAQIVNANCGGCNMTLPTAQVKLVRDADTEVQICENCGRMLAP